MTNRFQLEAPQVAHHPDGYRVAVIDRHSVEYRDGTVVATVEVEFGGVVTVYADSLAFATEPPDRPSNGEVLSRVSKGLEAMGSRVDLA